MSWKIVNIVTFWPYKCSTILILTQWVNSKICQNLMDEDNLEDTFFPTTKQFSFKNNIVNWHKKMTLGMFFNPNCAVSKKVFSIYAVTIFTLFIWNHSCCNYVLIFCFKIIIFQIYKCSTILILIQWVDSKIYQNLMDEAILRTLQFLNST